MNRALRSLPAALAALALAAAAHADPLLGPDALAPVPSRLLAEQARLDRRVHPAAWQRIAALQSVRPEFYLTTRVRRPSASRELQALGPDALLPMLDLLAGAGVATAMNQEERDALTLGALEAVAVQRDPRASAVLRAAFTRLRDPAMLRAAARGIAALGTPDDLAFLSARLSAPDGRGLAALQGLGALRTRASLDLAAAALRAARDADTVTAAADALGEIGSSWASAASDGDRGLTDAAAEALVPAFLRAEGRARDALQVAILSCGGARAATLLSAARPSLDAAGQARVAFLLRALRRGG